VHLPTEPELRAEATALLRDLLRIDTSNPPGGEKPAAALPARYLEAHGVECELIARDPGRANLVARIRGHGTGPSLALLGHTDVVPAEDPEAWAHPPFAGHVDDAGYIWGRGAADMKNELATRAVAMTALARAGVRMNGDLVLIAEADEEDGSEAAGLRWLVEARPDIATDYALNEGSAERLERRPACTARPPGNVMPARERECDRRPVTGTSIDELRAELTAALGDDMAYEITYPEPVTGGSVSSFETPLADACRDWFARRDPDATLRPMICNGFTDSHYLREAFGTIAYGIWPIRHTPNEVLAYGTHGRDERIHVDDLGYATSFHIDVCQAIGQLERSP
jgi:acetylornithine deacetylase/succinyl-diaminopimelate desuccinylase-like protein